MPSTISCFHFMKRLFYLLAGLSVLSCTQEILPTDSSDEVLQEQAFYITTGDNSTKTLFVDNKLEWQENDAVGLFVADKLANKSSAVSKQIRHQPHSKDITSLSNQLLMQTSLHIIRIQNVHIPRVSLTLLFQRIRSHHSTLLQISYWLEPQGTMIKRIQI